MGFPKQVVDSVLVKCQRCCCICHKFCGSHIELHHIKQATDGGPDTEENCIPLCFDCHADVGSYNTRHPKGHKYTESELKLHREKWFEKVKNGINYFDNSELRQVDISTYKKLKILFEGEEEFLSKHNFAGVSFSIEHLDPLYEYAHLCTLPEYEFFDADLEIAKSSLKNSIVKFIYSISVNTFPLRTIENYQSVPQDWEYEQPVRFDKVTKELNELSDDVWNKYCEFVRLARGRLAVA